MNLFEKYSYNYSYNEQFIDKWHDTLFDDMIINTFVSYVSVLRNYMVNNICLKQNNGH